MSYTVESLTEVGMPIAMVALMEAAAKWEPITYKHIAERIEPIIRSPIASEHIGHVVGSMMYRIQDVEPAAPLLNLLCVNGVTKLPGSGAHGFIKAYNSRVDYNRLTKAEKREMLRPLMDEVYKFGGWSALAKKVFGVTANIQMQQPAEADGKARRLGLSRGGLPESEEHRQLKEYVCNNPQLFGAPKGCLKGEMEKRLRSLDEIDVWFVSPGLQLAVEVKSRRSNELDLERGIFQCVKYRAVLEAENKADKIKSIVRASLVSERQLPSNLKRLAEDFDIKLHVAVPT